LILGLSARPAALILAAEMLAAYFLVAAPRGPWPIRNGGGEALVHVLIDVCIVIIGAGRLSIDYLLTQRARTREEMPVVTAETL